MILTILRILFLRLRNNPLELLLVFAMPVAFFSIFAAIFSNGITTSSGKQLRVGWIANRESALGQELRAFLEENSTLHCQSLMAEPSLANAVQLRQAEVVDDQTVERLITEAQRSGLYDLILRLPANFPAGFTEKDPTQPCCVRLVTDGQNPMAVAIVTSVVRGFFVQKKAALMTEHLMAHSPSSHRSLHFLEPDNGNRSLDSLLDESSSIAQGSDGFASFDLSKDPLKIIARGTQFLDPAKTRSMIFRDDQNAQWSFRDANCVLSAKGVLGPTDGLSVATSRPDRSTWSQTPPEPCYFQPLEHLSQISVQGVQFRNPENALAQFLKRDSQDQGLIGEACTVTSVDGILSVASGRIVAEPKSNSATAKLLTTALAKQPFSDSVDAFKISVENPQSEIQENPRIAMYAAGIAVLFLLFSSTGNAATLLEEAESGTLERILVGRASLFHIIGGKWLGIFLLGCVQISVMFLWAELVFQIQLWKHLDGFMVMTGCTAAATASLAMLMATVCRSRAQLNAVSVVVILSMSAVGGSMIPRFVMSDRMKDIGKWTFNAWALDGYQKVFWYQSPISSLLAEVTVLTGSAFVFGVLALIFSRRWKCR